MPGKQMAIDAELSTPGSSPTTRPGPTAPKIADEADFYGAMDGASKFVRGDAIAAIVIMAINLIGGIAVGMLQHHDCFSTAINTYSLLSVGDGLAAQMPALLISLVDRHHRDPGGLRGTSAATCSLSSPSTAEWCGPSPSSSSSSESCLGCPSCPSCSSASCSSCSGAACPSTWPTWPPTTPQVSVPPPPGPDAPAQLAKETGVMPLELELGMDIIDLVDPKRHGDLLERVKALRRTIAQELGIVIPPVHARDNERLQPTHYAFRVHGVQVAEGEAPQRFLLAVGKGLERIEGEPTRDPAYGGAAKWITNEMRYRATVAGATVVERSAVVTTHFPRSYGATPESSFAPGRAPAPRHGQSREPRRLRGDDLGGPDAGIGAGRAARPARRGRARQGPRPIIEAITDQAATASKDPDSLLEAARIALAPQIAAMFARPARRT